MIVLDTNVLSELARPQPAVQVVDWLDAQDPVDLVISAMTAAEIRAGVALLPAGRRRRQIGDRMATLLDETFAGHVLAFDAASTPHYAAAVATRSRAGRPISGLDALIAAVCLQHDAALATRDRGGFEGLGIALIDPWDGV